MICWQAGNYRIRKEELVYIKESYAVIDHACPASDDVGWFPFTYQPNLSWGTCVNCNEAPSEATQALFWFLVEDTTRNYTETPI